MGASLHPHRIVPAWTETLGALRAEKAEITAVCSGTHSSTKADLNRMIAAKGPMYSLWNRSFSCPRPDCAGRVTFNAVRPGANVWPTMMSNGWPQDVDALHQAWRDAVASGDPAAVYRRVLPLP